MAIEKCRVCKTKFYDEPLLVYKNMPGSAQYFPDKDTIDNDLGIDLEICQCSGCGLIQLNCEPVHYYREVIRAAGFSDEMKKFRREQFNKFIIKYNLKKKKITEIGCGTGEYLSIMNEFDVQTYGLEYSEASVSKCIKNGLNVSKGFFECDSLILPDSPYDAFMIMSFLEHLPDPNSILRGIWNNLSDQGIGIVEVPNFDMIINNNLFSEFINDHLLYFTKDTFKLTLEQNGFEVFECESVWYDYILSAVVGKREISDLSNLKQYEKNIIIEIREFLKTYGPGKVAVWGAGHQALTILSMLNQREKIRYVVDSAAFKQGKYTPATHIPIVSPDSLINDPVEAVIIMAASYSNEVANIIREKSMKITTVILENKGLKTV
jgi:2-polyprenyl-3-methyl-5-hydroxy-6-metoxy-1,4-benzoquinol methylase